MSDVVYLGDLTTGTTYLRPIRVIPREGPGTLVRRIHLRSDNALLPGREKSWIFRFGVLDAGGQFTSRYESDRNDPGINPNGLNTMTPAGPIRLSAGEVFAVHVTSKGRPRSLEGVVILPEYTETSDVPIGPNYFQPGVTIHAPE